MANAYFYSNVAVQTTLSGSISSGALTLTVGAVTGFPSSFPYILALDYGAATEELVTVTNASGTILTVTRGFGGTSAQSHSSGAVVRHVYNATDATDFRTHEAATASVHGVTGALVGATQTQTLTNKTLTAPTITSPTVTGGGSLAGTFTGTPTFSGNVVFSGSPSFTGTVQSNQSGASNVALATIVTADTFDRFRTLASGAMEWGPGTGARDSFLARATTNVLATTDTTFRAHRTTSTNTAISTRAASETQDRLAIDAAGKMLWGSGSGAGDTNLYRNSAGVLKTDGSLSVVGSIESAITTTTGISPASGWTVTTEIFRETAGINFANITLNRSGSTISAPGGTNGNVSPDLQLLTGVPTDWRPTAAVYFTAATGVNSGAGRINTDGSVDLTDWEPNQDITSGANMRLSWVII